MINQSLPDATLQLCHHSPLLFASRLATGLPFSQRTDVHAHPYDYHEAVGSRGSPVRSLDGGLRRGCEHPHACERDGEDAPVSVEGRIVGGHADRSDGEALSDHTEGRP